MAYGYGRCTNFDYCSVAESRKDIAAPTGAGFKCPECGKPLKVPSKIEGGTGRLVAVAAVAVLALAGGGYYFYTQLGAGAGHVAATVPATPAQPSAETAPKLALATQAPAAAPSDAKPLPSTPVQPAPIPSALVLPPPANVVLRLSGSNTVGAVLGPKLAQSFLADAGDTNVAIVPGGKPDEVRVVGLRGGAPETITVAAHGSATAFTDLAQGAADIGMASRRIKPAEANGLVAMGDMTSASNEHVLALDGIAVVVHPANMIPALTQVQLRAIFSGSITNWSQLGQPAGDIHVFARDDKSGTYDTFKSLVLGTAKLAPAAKRVEDSSELSNDVAHDPNAIGFIGLPYILSARAVPVAEVGAMPLLPNRLTVGTEDYALSRRLFLYTASNSANPLVRRFADYALSPRGQAIAEQVGFIPLTIKPEATPVPQTASAKYRALVGRATRLSTNFRFQPNSAALDNRGQRDLDRLINYVVSAHLAPTQIVLVGFADNQGAAATNLSVSRKRAEAVAASLAQRGLRVGQVAAFGSDLPVADNSTDAGREKNRRVEVYLAL